MRLIDGRPRNSGEYRRGNGFKNASGSERPAAEPVNVKKIHQYQGAIYDGYILFTENVVILSV